MKYKELKFVAVEYKHGWSVWVSKDGAKSMLGSAIKTEEEVQQLIGGMKLEMTRYEKKVDVEKEKLKEQVAELEEYKFLYENLSKVIGSINETNMKFGKSKLDLDIEPNYPF